MHPLIFVTQPNSTPMNTSIRENAQKFGLLAAAVGIAYALIAYLVSADLFVNWWAGVGIWVIMIVFFVMAATNTRKALGGFMTFREAFTVTFLAAAIASLMSTVFNIVLFTLIDPEYAAMLQEKIIEKTVTMMQEWKAPQESIDETIAQMEGTNQFDLMTQVAGFFKGLIFWAILALIIAAATKRKQPEMM